MRLGEVAFVFATHTPGHLNGRASNILQNTCKWMRRIANDDRAANERDDVINLFTRRFNLVLQPFISIFFVLSFCRCFTALRTLNPSIDYRFVFENNGRNSKRQNKPTTEMSHINEIYCSRLYIGLTPDGWAAFGEWTGRNVSFATNNISTWCYTKCHNWAKKRRRAQHAHTEKWLSIS